MLGEEESPLGGDVGVPVPGVSALGPGESGKGMAGEVEMFLGLCGMMFRMSRTPNTLVGSSFCRMLCRR